MKKDEEEKRIREDERKKIRDAKARVKILVVGVGGTVGGIVGAREGVTGIIGGGLIGAMVGYSAYWCYEFISSPFSYNSA